MATTSITVAETPLVRRLLRRADDALILGHRLSEWTGRAPTLEEELALANIALDLIGQARPIYAHAGALTGHDEDALAYLRDAGAWRNCLLVELPNGDFAETIVRLALFSLFMDQVWRAATGDADPTLAAVAAKAGKEVAYHRRHAAEWLIRLGDGTAESRRRTEAALAALWPYTGELFEGEDAAARPAWDSEIDALLSRATLARPPSGWMQTGGRAGRHTEHLGHLLAEMQFLQRAYPGATW